MSNQKNTHYTAAMRALDRVCQQHGIPVTERLRLLYWHGVRYGMQRGAEAAVSSPQRDRKPMPKQRSSEARALRNSDTLRDSDTLHDSGTLSDSSLRDNRSDAGPDIGLGGAFRL